MLFLKDLVDQSKMEFIIRLKLSDMVFPKVITLSSNNCYFNSYLKKKKFNFKSATAYAHVVRGELLQVEGLHRQGVSPQKKKLGEPDFS